MSNEREWGNLREKHKTTFEHRQARESAAIRNARQTFERTSRR